MRIKRNVFLNVDWILIILFGVLCLLGWINIYAATYSEEHQNIFDMTQSYGKQMLWIITACVLAFLILKMDRNFFETYSYAIYALSILLLIAVLIFGKEIKGAKSWFVIANTISLQPSEIAKFGAALALSKYLSSFFTKMQNWSHRVKAVLIVVAPAVIILLQPDTGSTLVFASLVFVMYREGLSGNILLIALTAIVFFVLAIMVRGHDIELLFGLTIDGKFIFIFVLFVIAALVFWVIKRYKKALLVVGTIFIICTGYVLSVDYIFDKVLSSHQQNRINELLGVTFDPTGAGYNVYQSKIAIGSGGFSGKGFLQGTQTKYDFVPEQSTDFIFCTVGEEWGFLGSFVMLCVFLFLIVRLVFIAERQKLKFSRVYGYCVASILFFHFAINIGMTIGLAPVIGIPLPFFSYGGSSLWSFTLLLFTFIKLDSERQNVLS